MAEDVRCSIVRTNVASPIASNIVIQISKAVPLDAEVDPRLYVKCYTTMLPLNNPQLILFQDYIVDQVVIDGITGTARRWQIIDDPTADLMTGDWKFAAVRLRR